MRTSPAFARNFEPITQVLSQYLPATGVVLEVASGPGEHLCAWAARFHELHWLPSDLDAQARESISARLETLQLGNVTEPLAIDLSRQDWPTQVPMSPDVIVGVNVLHISPWTATLGLFRGARQCLAENGVLLVYGPFLRVAHSVPSNDAFSAQLRSQDANWGVRDLAVVEGAAAQHGMSIREVHEMPANNLILALSVDG
ncbi:MAG: hypothetical protein ACI8PT_004678 [Gammaproteobacteria bacterium]|jgi:hypothetical protein